MSVSSISRRLRLGGAGAAVLTAGLVVATQSSALPSLTASRSATGSTADVALAAVSGVSPRQVWAVGGGIKDQTVVDVVELWDGTHWHRMQVPVPGASSELFGVTSLNPRDAWAVGDYTSPQIGQFGLMLHWDGYSWTEVPAAPSGNYTYLQGVSGSRPTDVWAVGFGERAIIEHWTGQRWQKVTAPTHRINDQLYAVHTLSSTDAWAVGQARAGQAMVYHWDGSTWSLAQAEIPPGVESSALQGVDGQSAEDVWAVGYTFSVTDGPAGGRRLLFQQLIEQFDGTAWSIVPSPPLANSILTGVSETSPTDIWATGYLAPRKGLKVLIEHWNGHRWSVSTKPLPGAGAGVLGLNTSDAWVVGYDEDGQLQLRDHWDGSSWTHR